MCIRDRFYNVYSRAETFKTGEITDPIKLDRRIKAWLSQIAKNELRQLLKTTIPYLNKHKFTESTTTKEPSELSPYLRNDAPVRIERDLIDKALNSLSEREKDVLLTYTRFQEGKKKLPTEELERLSTLYDTTSDNLRQIRSRALKKVKDYILSLIHI